MPELGQLLEWRAQAKNLTPGEIVKLKQNGVDPELLKEESAAGRGWRSDLYKLPNGDIIMNGKGGISPGEPTGICINKLYRDLLIDEFRIKLTIARDVLAPASVNALLVWKQTPIRFKEK